MKLETEKTDKKRGFRMGSKNKRTHDPVRASIKDFTMAVHTNRKAKMGAE